MIILSRFPNTVSLKSQIAGFLDIKYFDIDYWIWIIDLDIIPASEIPLLLIFEFSNPTIARLAKRNSLTQISGSGQPVLVCDEKNAPIIVKKNAP